MPSFGLKRHKSKGPKYPPPTPERIAPRPPAPGGLRIAFLVYRGNPRCGGQGVYTRHLTRELVELGHSVEVFAGQPWPELDEGVGFTPVPSLDLYRDPDPFRVPQPARVRNSTRRRTLPSSSGSCARAGFPEPWTFSHPGPAAAGRPPGRVRPGPRQPVPGQRDAGDDRRRLAAADHAAPPDHRRPAAGPVATPTNPWQRFTQRRWFGFLRMQVKVARALPRVVTVSQSSQDGHRRPDGRGRSTG